MKREKRTGEQLKNKMILQAKITGVEISCEYCKHKQDYWHSRAHLSPDWRLCSIYKSYPYHYKLWAHYHYDKDYSKKIYHEISNSKYSQGSSRFNNRKICKRWVAGSKQ